MRTNYNKFNLFITLYKTTLIKIWNGIIYNLYYIIHFGKIFNQIFKIQFKNKKRIKILKESNNFLIDTCQIVDHLINTAIQLEYTLETIVIRE